MPESIDSENAFTCIRLAQSGPLYGILGECLYTELNNRVEGGTISDVGNEDYLELFNISKELLVFYSLIKINEYVAKASTLTETNGRGYKSKDFYRLEQMNSALSSDVSMWEDRLKNFINNNATLYAVAVTNCTSEYDKYTEETDSGLAVYFPSDISGSGCQ